MRPPHQGYWRVTLLLVLLHFSTDALLHIKSFKRNRDYLVCVWLQVEQTVLEMGDIHAISHLTSCLGGERAVWLRSISESLGHIYFKGRTSFQVLRYSERAELYMKYFKWSKCCGRVLQVLMKARSYFFKQQCLRIISLSNYGYIGVNCCCWSLRSFPRLRKKAHFQF